MPSRRLNLPKQRKTKVPANIIKRFLAFIADIIIVSFIVSPLETVIRSVIPGSSSAFNLISTAPTSLLTAVSIVIAAIAIIYFSVLEYRFGQTIGKMIAGISIVSENRKLTYWQCLIRNLFLLPFIPFVLLWVIDPLYAIFTRENRRFSDIIAKTKAIEYYEV